MFKLAVIKIIISVLLAVLFSCRTHKVTTELTVEEMEVPPNGIKLSSNLYIDKTEVTNYSYNEFMYWYRMVYGEASAEYKKTIPNDSGWYQTGYHSFVEYYRMHPAYRDYPVVNVSYDQATLFCKWRADRVMEFILIREGIIKFVPAPHKDSLFTIEKYFTGNYRGIVPNKGLIIYPQYSLPDSATYMMALVISDSLSFVNQKIVEKSVARYDDWVPMRCYESISFKNDTIHYGPDPIVAVDYPGIKRSRFDKTNAITHLLGNVREMTNLPDITFGGSYKDSCATIGPNYFKKEEGSNCYTGFRCMCTYKKWEAN